MQNGDEQSAWDEIEIDELRLNKSRKKRTIALEMFSYSLTFVNVNVKKT